MKLTVIVDNNTYIDQYYLGEPAVSYLVEIDGHRILFDTGYSDIVVTNAEKMNIDLANVTEIVLSHGHNDHSRGLKFLLGKFELSDTALITHPDALADKIYENEHIGSPFIADVIAQKLDYVPSREPYFISDNCVFLGEIPQTISFEKRLQIGTTLINDKLMDDYVVDDSAIACLTSQGIVIITGCSHCGICNIIEYAQKVFGTSKIAAVIGGFHLLEDNKHAAKTIEYLEALNADVLYPCHCVSFDVKARMTRTLNVKEVGVGLTLQL